MAKVKKRIQKQKENNSSGLAGFDFDELLPKKFHVLAVILIIIILFLIFLNPLYFGNKTFQSGDIVSSSSLRPYVENHEEGYTLWNPYIFLGMPAYAMGVGYKWFNLIYVCFTFIRTLFSSFFSVHYAMWSFYLIVLGITSFFLMRYLTKNTFEKTTYLVSLFTAIATSFSTGLIVFLFIGHVTKLTSIAFYPLIFLMLLRFQKKIKLIDVLILIITLQLFVQGFHAQIIFYTIFAVAIYFIYFFLRALIKKEKELRTKILKSAAAFIFCIFIALLIQSDNITQIYEYTPYSTRGTESIVDKVSGKQEINTSGYYEYHTNWSFSPEEVFTFIVPSFYGFGNSTYKGPLTQNQPVEVNTYFGQMPFVDVAMYMGILVFALGLFAVFTEWKNPFVQFLTILSGIALIISFGKNFPVLFDLLFYNLPYFNKFRVPSMILVLVQLSFPVLAGLGLMKIISLKNERNEKLIKVIKNLAILFLSVFIISLLLNSAISDWFTSRIIEYAQGIQQTRPQLAQQFTALADYTAGMFTGDLLFSFAFLSLIFWGALGYINSKISSDFLVAAAIVLTLIDLWRIDSRGAKYIDNPDVKNLFNQPEYISAIKNQNDKEPFRIFNLKQDGSLGSFNNNSNFNANFLVEDFYGYSALKPRTYQDIADVVGLTNPYLWRMLNVKYIITDKPVQHPGFTMIDNSDKSVVYKNENALPRVYLVDSVKVKTGIGLLNEIKEQSFDPKNVAFVDNELKVDVPDSTAYSKIIQYKDETIKVEVKASGNNFLFLGNTYLPTGWKAEIDDNETKIYKANYGFMGIVVPEGKHTVVFKYAPASFFISKYIALILSSLVIAGFACLLFLNTTNKYNSLQIKD